MRALAVETIGTTFLVAAACLAGTSDSPLAPLAVPAVLTALLLAADRVGGGLFNPAVAAAAWVSRLTGGRDLLWALGGQGIGVVLGVAWALSVTDMPVPPADAVGVRQATLAEAGVTAAVALATLLAAGSGDAGRHRRSAVPAGLLLLAGTVTVGPLTGAAFNPAVAVGLVASGALPWTVVAAYVPAQLLAGVAAAVTAAGLRRLARPVAATAQVGTAPAVAAQAASAPAAAAQAATAHPTVRDARTGSPGTPGAGHIPSPRGPLAHETPDPA